MSNQAHETIKTADTPQVRQLRKLIVYGNPEKAGVDEALSQLLAWCRQRQARLIVSSEIEPFLRKKPLALDDHYETYPTDGAHPDLFDGHDDTMLITLGGDGTLIHAIRYFWPIPVPVMGVNLGQLGFNASVEPSQMTQTLEAWEAGRANSSKRMLLHVKWIRDDKIHAQSVAMNDVVLTKQNDSRLIHLTLRQRNEVISSFAADGLIVASPTGSTAYNLSAGGPIVHPTMLAMIATGICPHTLGHRPVILPPHPPLTLKFEPRQSRDHAKLWIDGQESWPIQEDDRVVLEAQDQMLELITSPQTAYYAMLRRKLHWGGELETTPPPDSLKDRD